VSSDSQFPSAPMVGLHDRKLDGWADADTREIAPGVAVNPGMQVVDVGCGDGGYASFCARMGADLTFIDIQEEKVLALESQLKAGDYAGEIRGIVTECNPIPLPDSYADLVMSTEVLEHVTDPERFLAEMVRIGKDDAIFVLTVPDSRGETLIKATAPKVYFCEPNHIQIFTPVDFRQLAESCGLEIIEHKHVGAFWAIFFLLKWASSDDDQHAINEANHPMTQHWTKVWQEILKHPQGEDIRQSLNNAVPSSQVIVARKRSAD
jgi:ubiquinone/menaquinone biosynthesis C-methylase UbiE